MWSINFCEEILFIIAGPASIWCDVRQDSVYTKVSSIKRWPPGGVVCQVHCIACYYEFCGLEVWAWGVFVSMNVVESVWFGE